MELTNVTLSIHEGSKRVALVRSKQALFIPSAGVIKLGEAEQLEITRPELKSVGSFITVDMRSGEIRSTQGFYLDLSEMPIAKARNLYRPRANKRDSRT